MPGIVCVVPTIRKECHAQFIKAWTPLFEKHKVTLVTVWDGEAPHVIVGNSGMPEITGDVMMSHEGYRDLFCRRTDAVRNLGFTIAARMKPDYVLTLDDDVTPLSVPCPNCTGKCVYKGHLEETRWDGAYRHIPCPMCGGTGNSTNDPIQAHLDVLQKRVPISWMNTAHDTDLYLRGVPYGVRDEAPVMLSHGVWVGTPDFDGETQLRLEQGRECPKCGITEIEQSFGLPACKQCGALTKQLGVPYSLPYYVGPIPKGVLFPLCFVPSAEVTMADGSRKPISEMKEGDRVFTREGKSHKVLRVMETPHDGNVVKLRVAGRDTELVCTPNHNLWVLRPGHATPNWVAASEVTTDDMMATPVIDEPAELSLPNLSTCKLLGYFLAEGNYSKYSPNAKHSKAGEYTGLMFTFGTDKKQEAIKDCCHCLDALGVGWRLEHPKASATVVATKTCYDLVALLRETYYIGEWAHGKRLPKGVYGWDVSRKRALLAAYWAGDGCFSTIERIKGTTQYQCQAKTRSRTMALQIQLLMQSLGFPASVARLSAYKQSKESWAISINGARAREFKEFLEGGLVPPLGKRRYDHAYCAQGFNFYSVKEVSRVKYEGPVFNLTVEDDHTYLVEGLTVKNCGMNMMVRAAALPYLYFAPMGSDTGICRYHESEERPEVEIPLLNRFADIWMGVFLKRAFDQMGWACYTGASTVLHTRASDAKKNFEQEKLGREWNEKVSEYGPGYLGFPSIKEMQNPSEFARYFYSYAEKRKRYADLITKLFQGGGS